MPKLIQEIKEAFIDDFDQKIIGIHDRSECASDGRCVIHQPTDHHMRDWKLLWRNDRAIFERICPHGVGHPDPDDLHYQTEILGDVHSGVHGCDGCCAPPTDVE